MSDERILPVVQGDWVAENHDGRIVVGRIRQSYECGDEVLMDVVYYDPDGVKVGRSSPDEGGPKTFEPAVPFDDRWTRIEAPAFPLKRESMLIPSETPGRSTLVYTYYHGGYGAAKRKAIRTKKRKQSRDYARRPSVVFIPKDPSNEVDIEIAALRRSAQELRDVARNLVNTPGHTTLIDKARKLEAEAAALARKE
ncbi:hypothetical protein HOU02_gp424 [Caulobacter phage CcrBL9]|uniref:Uncharacterized protein n=1 Tax=Caulobacter phage CcrBL9 TaxID=2283270 RepID=A0A385EBN4_9CAUD|nr:hypothetical protein HOU02_gp424 [Caulobacter phage CcrBL9]AXQ69301.1 hypothetical protein CcrBL9_gp277c [Caulobacter phage CcrBL9]